MARCEKSVPALRQELPLGGHHYISKMRKAAPVPLDGRDALEANVVGTLEQQHFACLGRRRNLCRSAGPTVLLEAFPSCDASKVHL
jgi:hypothetical protein